MLYDRFSTAGLAHSAADQKTEETGVQYVMSFQPRSRNDRTPFTIIIK